mgnify:FL=1
MIDFEEQFRSDEELEEALDSLLEGISDELEEEEAKPSILNPHRMEQMQFAYAALKYITRNTDAKVSYKLQQPFKTMGCISVEGKLLEFDKPEWFARVAEFASNTEVYPLSKNAVRLTFTFHGLTTLMEGGAAK